LQSCRSVQWYEPEAFLQLDALTLRHLDIVKNGYTQSKEYSLFGFLDQAQTPMGSRLLKRWLVRPLQDRQAILQRLDAVDFFVSHPALTTKIRSLLKEYGDVERVIGRIIVDKAPVSDYVQIEKCTKLLPQLVSLLLGYQEHPSVQLFLQYISIFPDLHEYLERSLYDGFEYEYIIKPGFDERIDRARELVEHASQKILQLELQEQQRTGISGLKIRHNSVQGYYIELTKMQAQEVPSDYKRLQTLVGKERFMTDQLAYLQHDIEYAAQSMGRLEKEIFESGLKHIFLFYQIYG
jgi:DNA mismatch repair protein MutS